jgi:segregation and condensation protein B
MQNGNIIPIDAETVNWKNRFPGASAFVETFDTDGDACEPADVLSFETLRQAFATIQSAEVELMQTVPKIELSSGCEPESPEKPHYEIDHSCDLEDGDDWRSLKTEPHVTVGIRPETIIEAMLFVGNRENRPLGAEQIAEKLRNVSPEEVDQAVVFLNEQYQERNCPYIIVSKRGGYQMVLRVEFEPVRSNFYGKIRDIRLSQQAIDTLAVVAYQQPITADEIQNLRQQSCSAVLTQLVRRNLLSTVREVHGKKNVVHYRTTPRFLELLRIKSLDEIPKTEEWDHR